MQFGRDDRRPAPRPGGAGRRGRAVRRRRDRLLCRRSARQLGLSTPQSAILSAIIFNAVIIIALIPLSLKGVRYRPIGAAALLRLNLLIYGVGGVIIPFFGIKAIDLVVTALHLA